MNIRLTPLIILAVLNLIGLGIIIGKHGQPDKYNGWMSFLAFIINWGLILWMIL